MSNWISVNDRLPEDTDGNVLVRCNGETFIASRWNNKWWCFGEPSFEPWIFDRDSITHWMPLPDPPEQEKP